jgi:hypothetical protein
MTQFEACGDFCVVRVDDVCANVSLFAAAACTGQSPDYSTVEIGASCAGLASDNVTSCAAIWNAAAVQDEFSCGHGGGPLWTTTYTVNASNASNTSNASNGSSTTVLLNNGCNYVPAYTQVTGYDCATDFASLSDTTTAACTHDGMHAVCQYTAVVAASTDYRYAGATISIVAPLLAATG